MQVESPFDKFMECKMNKLQRGSRVDGEATRMRILEAAGELFGASGFAETTSKSIAARAGADVASINYHFGSRNGLYQAVLIEAHRRFVDIADLRPLVDSSLPAVDKLKRLIDRLVSSTTDQSGGWHLTVLAAEILAPTSNLQVLLQSQVPVKATLVMRILSEITGIPPAEPALMRCMLNVMAPALVMLISRPGLASPIQSIWRMPPEDIRDHLYRFALAGLKAIGDDYASHAVKQEAGGQD